MNPEDLLGLIEEEAIKRIKSVRFKARIMRRDDRFFMGTMDFRNDRINLEIDGGIVTRAYVG